MAEPGYLDGRKVSEQKTMDQMSVIEILGNLVEIRHRIRFQRRLYTRRASRRCVS